eukprot:TRINITY_DN1851_c0_g1_i8.p1 TRINITY_DN1851_c0_g1~~TRINITY_DN1851_c0_g1_i8.p1  ORF type:complete len:424 (+),score=78.65 TRINITY_DN1851_c0_g1_i8:1215-2486(+)
MAALYQEAKQNPQSARWLEQFSARLKNLQSKRDSASKSLRKLRQGCEDEIENNLRRFLISIGAETSGFSIGAESIGAEISGLVEPVLSRETLLEMVGAAHKQAARFTHGELDRIQAKLHIFESYCVSLEEEAKSGARWVGPVSPESLLEARDEVKTTTTALANQICQSKTPLVAEQKADLALIHWDLVRLQVICLNAVRAGFKVTRDTTAHDALSTTTIRAHEPGTRWSLQDVKELLKKLEVVKADALGACQEIQRMGFLFACDPKVITWEKLCDCFKDTVRQIQLQQKSGRLNKLQAQVSSLSAEITAEESRLVLLSDEEIETAILRLGQQIGNLHKENVQQRSFLEGHRSKLFNSKEDSLVRNLSRAQEELRHVETEQVRRAACSDDTDGQADVGVKPAGGKQKKKKKPAFTIHDTVTIID